MKSLWNDIRVSFAVRKTSPVLLYHFVEPNPAELRGNTDAVLLDKFQAQILRLKKRFQFVFIDELMERLEAGKPMAGLAAITFDDGTRSVMKHALPWLAEWKIPSTVFLNSSLVQGDVFWRDKVKFIIHHNLAAAFIDFAGSAASHLKPTSFYSDTKNANRINPLVLNAGLDNFLKTRADFQSTDFGYYANLDELKHALTDFVQYGNHTATHYNLSGLTLDDQRAEIHRCQQFLETHFSSNQRSSVFAIPFGDKEAFNDHTVQALQQCNYKHALTTQSDRYLQARNINHETRNGLWLYNRFMPRHYSFRFI